MDWCATLGGGGGGGGMGAEAVVHRLRHGPGDGSIAVRRFVESVVARLEAQPGPETRPPATSSKAF